MYSDYCYDSKLPMAWKGKKLTRSNTTKNPAEPMKATVPKKKDNLAIAFCVFAPATANTMPRNDKDILTT